MRTKYLSIAYLFCFSFSVLEKRKRSCESFFLWCNVKWKWRWSQFRFKLFWKVDRAKIEAVIKGNSPSRPRIIAISSLLRGRLPSFQKRSESTVDVSSACSRNVLTVKFPSRSESIKYGLRHKIFWPRIVVGYPTTYSLPSSFESGRKNGSFIG